MRFVHLGSPGSYRIIIFCLEREERKRSLYLMAGEEVVFGLLDDGADEIEAVGDGPGLGDLLGGPLAGAPVEGPAAINDVVHGTDGLLNGRGGVGAMAVEHVDVVHVEALERGLGALHDVLAREALVVGPAAAPEDLGRHHQIGAPPSELPEGLPHYLLRSPVRVHLRVVEEVHAMVAAAL